MKVWKILAILTFVILLAMGAFVGYMYSVAKIQITAVNAKGVSCGDDPAAFEELKDSVTAGTFMGTIYQKPQNWKAA